MRVDASERPLYYALGGEDGRTPEPTDQATAGKLLADCDARRVARDEVALPEGGSVVVSTVFLVVDHAFLEEEPVLFETRTFGLSEEAQRRYHALAEAEAGHAEVLAETRRILGVGEEVEG